MSINKYRFVSPGVQAQEVDNSILPKTPDEIGPVVIGRSVRGPMMRPVHVESYQDFVEIFGEPHPGGESIDPWRNGNKAAPTYGAYAAQAYLKNSNALTFVRLGGYQNTTDATIGKAGWSTTNVDSGSSATTNGGAYGLFLANTTGSGDVTNTTGTLAAIIYLDQGTVKLSGSQLSGSDTAGSGQWIKATGDNYQFKIVINNGTVSEDYTVNFDTNSQNYIRKVLNTNPTLVNEDRVSSSKTYWLGETFKTALDKNLNNASGLNVAGFIARLSSGSVNQAVYLKQAEESITPWIVSQHVGDENSYTANSNGEYPVTKLFRLHGLSEGDWLTKNVKISIEDIAVPNNSFNKYGTFTVSLRKIDDTDLSPQYLERFVNVSLDPNADNFISKVIGDKYSTWDFNEKRFYEYGTYDNRSKYVRVEVNQDLELGAVAPELIPFGFYGPRRFSSFTLSGSSANIPASAFLDADFYGVAVQNKISGNANVTASFVFPSIPVLDSSLSSSASSLRNIFWGMKTNVGTGKLFNEDIKDILTSKPAGYSEGTGDEYSFFFSLDDIRGVDSLNDYANTMSEVAKAEWVQGCRKIGTSLTAMGVPLSGSTGLLQTFNKFTLPFVGGFDGLDITEKDPFNKTVLEGSTESTNYAFNSVKIAIEAVSDPEVVEMNLVAMPGIENEGLTGLLIDKCEMRGDALAVIDLKGDFVPAEANKETVAQRKPVVNTVIDNLNARGINSSYGCAFFPWVQVKDNANNKSLWVPPSVIALGTMSKSQRDSELWFAPAGFNRGGLTEGAAGIGVSAVSLKLTSRDRDNLYAANINPIASFPSEGIVVFGQKTLQVTPSALDRINVRRLMIYLKKEISRMATTVLFDPNIEVTWKRFTNQAVPFLDSVKSRFGLSEYKLVLDETTTTPELVDRNTVYAKVLLKPARAIEFMAIDFNITKTGSSFID